MMSKIRIKMGTIEIDYEGTEEFIKDDLLKLLSSISEIFNKITSVEQEPKGGGGLGDIDKKRKPIMSVTLSSISDFAAKLECKSAPNLIVAACAYLTFKVGAQSCTRKQISDEMKNATAYFGKNYLRNLSKDLKRLVANNKLSEQAKDVYALKAEYLGELRKKLGIS